MSFTPVAVFGELLWLQRHLQLGGRELVAPRATVLQHRLLSLALLAPRGLAEVPLRPLRMDPLGLHLAAVAPLIMASLICLEMTADGGKVRLHT